MKGVIFDSDVIIEILRVNKALIEEMRKETLEILRYCSTITIGEVYAGMRPEEARITQKLLSGFIHLPVTSEIAHVGGLLKNRTKSHTLWLDDCLIAATALSYDCTLFTRNVKHYPFPKLKLHKVK